MSAKKMTNFFIAHRLFIVGVCLYSIVVIGKPGRVFAAKNVAINVWKPNLKRESER